MLLKSSRLILLASVLLFTLAILTLTNASSTPVTDDDGESTAKKIAKTTNPLCLSNEKQSAITMVALFILLFIALMFVYLVMRLNIHWFPDSIGVVIISAIIGGVFRLVIPQYLNIVAQLDAGIFFIVFLPVIIFDAGYSLDKGDFFGNLGSIILYAFIGTVNSVICIAAGVYFSGYMGWSIEVPWIECFMYGSLVSAIDTVATLAIFNALKVNSTLHSLVFGESIVNDAVVVALFETFEKFSNATSNTNTTTLILQGVGQFTLASAGSVIVGVVFALLASAFFRFIDVRKYRTLEIALFFVFAYLPYVATFPFLSGIMTVMTVGIVMSYYLTPNLSKDGAQSIADLSHSLSFVCETLVFVYMGMAVFAFDGVWEKFDWVLTLVIVITCMIGRAMNTFPITALVNLYRRNKISYRNQFIMWFSGGLRGAMAFALAVGWKRHNALADYFFTSTLIFSVFTIVVFGGLTYPFIRLFKVETKGHGSEAHSQAAADQKPENAKDAQTYWANILKERKEHRNLLTALDEKIMRKIFIRPDALQTINLTVASHNDYEDSAANEQELQETTPEVANREFDRIYESLTKNPSKLALYQRIIRKIEDNQGDSSSPSETAININ